MTMITSCKFVIIIYKNRLHNFFHKNPQERDLPQKLLKPEGQVMMGDKGWRWFPSIPQKPNTHKWASSQNKQKGAMSSSKSSLMHKRKKNQGKRGKKFLIAERERTPATVGSAQGTQPNHNVMIFSQGETTPTLVPSPSSVRP
jgi:hypothetical protein